MPRDPHAYLWDAREAIGRIRTFVHGKAFADYQADVLLRSAVERQFEIVGEALNRLSNVDPSTAEHVPGLARIVAFRNILIHGYAVVDDQIVWEAVTSRLEPLDDVLATLLGSASGGEDDPVPVGEADLDEVRRAILDALRAAGTRAKQVEWYQRDDALSLGWDERRDGVLRLTSHITGSSYWAETTGSSAEVLRALGAQAGEAEATLLRSPQYSG